MKTVDRLIVRTDSVLCTHCGQSEPLHPEDGTPMRTFVIALLGMVQRHRDCKFLVFRPRPFFNFAQETKP
jgi:hypothetical protein